MATATMIDKDPDPSCVVPQKHSTGRRQSRFLLRRGLWRLRRSWRSQWRRLWRWRMRRKSCISVASVKGYRRNSPRSVPLPCLSDAHMNMNPLTKIEFHEYANQPDKGALGCCVGVFALPIYTVFVAWLPHRRRNFCHLPHPSCGVAPTYTSVSLTQLRVLPRF